MKAIPKEDKSKQDKKTIKNHNKKRNIYIYIYMYTHIYMPTFKKSTLFTEQTDTKQ